MVLLASPEKGEVGLRVHRKPEVSSSTGICGLWRISSLALPSESEKALAALTAAKRHAKK
jgi:hypothetical protein